MKGVAWASAQEFLDPGLNGSSFIIVSHPRPQDSTEMSFVAWHDEVQALSSYRSHQSFTVGIRLRCPDRRTQYSQSEGVLYFCVQLRRKDRIAVVDEELTGMIARDGVPQLLECPFRRGMSRHIAKQNAAASDLQDQEHEQNPETRDHRHEKIAGHDARSMIADKGLPRWRRSSPASAARPLWLRPIFADGSRGNIDTQF